jgi:hypothetical protein
MKLYRIVETGLHHSSLRNGMKVSRQLRDPAPPLQGKQPPVPAGKGLDFFMLISCLAYSSTLKLEAIVLSETTENPQWNIPPYTPEDRTF